MAAFFQQLDPGEGYEGMFAGAEGLGPRLGAGQMGGSTVALTRNPDEELV